MSIKKIIGKILLVIILVVISVLLIKTGVYFNNLSKPSSVYGKTIDNINNIIKELFIVDKKYNLNDTFSINGTSSFELSSEEYTPTTNIKKYNTITNLNTSNISYSLLQDSINKELLFTIQDTSSKNLINYKFLVDNSTEYYFMDKIISNYINNGSCNYFENLGSKTTKENIDYLYNYTLESIKNSLKDEYFKTYKVNVITKSDTIGAYQMSLVLNNDTINKILENVLNNLKEDETSSTILNNTYEEFKNIKYRKKKYLEKDERYNINIYTNKTLYTPIKYEIIHQRGDDKKSLTYEGDSNDGTLSYIDNSNIEFIGKTKINKKTINISFTDQNGSSIGTLKYVKGVNNSNFNFLLNYDDKLYDIVLSSKFIDYMSENYTNEINCSFKITNKKIVRLSGNIKLINKISKKASIKENTENAILNASLNDNQKKLRDNYFKNIKERVENNG